MATDWNPPPPSPDPSPPQQTSPTARQPEVVPLAASGYDDTIGETVFSKAWVLSVLVSAVAAVEGKDGVGQEPKEGSAGGRDELEDVVAPVNTQGQGSAVREGDLGGQGEEEEGEDVQELEEGLETDLCRLWDASMNTDVCLFLLEQHAVELLLGVAARSHTPRLTEICVGILGNMACQESVCLQEFISNKQMQRVLPLLDSADPQVLYETTRLIHTCLSYEKTRSPWIHEIKQSSTVYQSMLFILRSSTNDELLRSVAVLLDRLLDSDEELLGRWVSRELVEGVCEAAEQARVSSFDATCTFVMSLQLISTIEAEIPMLVECVEQLCALLCNVLLSMELPEERGGGGDDNLGSHGPLLAALSLLTTLSESPAGGHVAASLSDSSVQTLLENLQRYCTLSAATEDQDLCLEQGKETDSNEVTSSNHPCSHGNTTVADGHCQRVQSLVQRLLLCSSLSPSAPSQ